MPLMRILISKSIEDDVIKNGVYILVEVSILNFNYLVSVTAVGPVSPRGHM